MLHRIEPFRWEYFFHLTCKDQDFLFKLLHHHLLDLLSTNLHVEVTEFSEHLSQISIEIATEHYRHQSFHYNMVVVTLQFIEFTCVDINCSFYVRRIAVWKLQCLKPLKYLYPIFGHQTVWSIWSSQISPCISSGLKERTIT
jgi:hypothetical protein